VHGSVSKPVTLSFIHRWIEGNAMALKLGPNIRLRPVYITTTKLKHITTSLIHVGSSSNTISGLNEYHFIALFTDIARRNKASHTGPYDCDIEDFVHFDAKEICAQVPRCFVKDFLLPRVVWRMNCPGELGFFRRGNKAG
jgi:hypothetical protein